mmetsp:Transcript_249/g.798  ORF Transcript_249/g.798 Transcript_249/m.798 type:complete len:260 (-) Transcript_249:197-976(-)
MKYCACTFMRVMSGNMEASQMLSPSMSNTRKWLSTMVPIGADPVQCQMELPCVLTYSARVWSLMTLGSGGKRLMSLACSICISSNVMSPHSGPEGLPHLSKSQAISRLLGGSLAFSISSNSHLAAGDSSPSQPGESLSRPKASRNCSTLSRIPCRNDTKGSSAISLRPRSPRKAVRGSSSPGVQMMLRRIVSQSVKKPPPGRRLPARAIRLRSVLRYTAGQPTLVFFSTMSSNAPLPAMRMDLLSASTAAKRSWPSGSL